MRVGIFGEAVNGSSVDKVIEEITSAEADGFSSFWTPQIFGLDAITALSVAAREVPRIAIGTGVVPTYPRHPMMLAQQALTLQQVSGGRFTLGIGLSHQLVIENIMGMSYEKPVRHLREYLSVLAPLLRGEPADFAGETYNVHVGLTATGIAPVPVVVAALGEQMLKLTARLAEGTVTWCTGYETLKRHTIPTIVSAAAEAERPAPRIVAALPVCVTDDVSGARERAAATFAMYGFLPSYRAMLDREGVAGPADIAIVGTSAEVAERIASFGEIGVTEFVAVGFAKDRGEYEATRSTLRSLL